MTFPLAGDQDILLSSDEQVTYDSFVSYWESYNLLSDSIILCAHAGDGDGSYGEGVSMYNSSGVMRHFFGTLFGWLGGKFILSLQGTDAACVCLCLSVSLFVLTILRDACFLCTELTRVHRGHKAVP